VVTELTDPASGELLGVVANRLGDSQVVQVQEKFSSARKGGPFEARRGDIVKLVGR